MLSCLGSSSSHISNYIGFYLDKSIVLSSPGKYQAYGIDMTITPLLRRTSAEISTPHRLNLASRLSSTSHCRHYYHRSGDSLIQASKRTRILSRWQRPVLASQYNHNRSQDPLRTTSRVYSTSRASITAPGSPSMYTYSFAFFEALWELGVTHCFVNLGSDHPSIIEAMVKGQREKKGQFPRIITCPNEVSCLDLHY